MCSAPTALLDHYASADLPACRLCIVQLLVNDDCLGVCEQTYVRAYMRVFDHGSGS